MKTEILSSNEIEKASEILRNGGIVGIPTETVYGLAANAFDGQAVAKIFKAKGRPMDNPLIVHICDINQIYDIVDELPDNAKKLADRFWPGPLTLIMPKSKRIPDEVSAGLNTVAVRFPSNKVARDIIRSAGVPLAAPSANLSGSPSPTTAKHVVNDLFGKIDAIVDGGNCDVGLESTVITLVTKPPKLLRPGGITLDELRDVLGKVDVDSAVLNKISKDQKVSSPGMKYKHYAPNAKVVLIKSDRDNYIKYVNEHANADVAALCYDEDRKFLNVFSVSYGAQNDGKSQAKGLFYALREIDKNKEIRIIYARCPDADGVGLAVYNRLIRAAGFEVLDI